MAPRPDALHVAYGSAEGRLGGMTFDEFSKATESWDVEPVEVDGQLVGAVLMNGPEIHACIKPEGFGRWLTRRVLRNTLRKTLLKHGEAVTRVTEGNAIGEHFVSRLGFKKEGELWVLRQQ